MIVKRHSIFIFAIASLSLCVSSCPIFFDLLLPMVHGGGARNTGSTVSSGKSVEEPFYEKEVVWSAEFDFFTNYGNPFADGKYGYYPANHYQNENRSCIIKMDFETGAVVWTTPPVGHGLTASPFKIGRYVYLPMNDGGAMYVYHDESGALAATVSFGPDETTAKNNGSISYHVAVSGDYVFWCNSQSDPGYKKRGLMRFDTGLIDFSKNPAEPQAITPRLIWERWHNEKNPMLIATNIAAEDGVVYFLTVTHAYYNPDWVSLLVALDAETGEEKWVRPVPPAYGDRLFSLVPDGERIHVLDMAPCSYNKADGSVIYENDFRTVDITQEGYRDAAWSLDGATLSNGKLYYTSGQHEGDYADRPNRKPGSVANILCLDPATGLLVWGALSPGRGSLCGTFPLVSNGKLYIVVPYTGLRVYDAETGALLGVDSSVFTLIGSGYNFMYRDMFVFIDEISYDSDKIKITAIRCR
ncbi:MAG: PQQ-binding-like beta-propeller repeat protein [Treponema sp.]|nr:PQQ-binding-like beta-propeller repeat protein [Treponema sp.]